MILGQACAKLILMGEHAVVYHHPALAVPLPSLRARVWMEPSASQGLLLEAPDLLAVWDLPVAPASSPEPLIETLIQALTLLNLPWPNATLRIESEIPIARGLGSGTALSTALWRALGAFFNRFPPLAETLTFVQSMDQVYHGRPSGLDAQVIVREQALYFQREQGVRPLPLAQPLALCIADSGQSSQTRNQIEKVALWCAREPVRSAEILAEIGALVSRARDCLARGEWETLGALLNRNHELLVEMGVSTPALDQLCSAARQAGAWGAKLSGAGGGGVMFCLLPEPACAPAVEAALRTAGATWVFTALIPATEIEDVR